MVPSAWYRLFLGALLCWVIGDLGCEVVLRSFSETAIEAAPAQDLSHRRLGLRRLAHARSMAIQDEADGTAILLAIYRDSPAPDLRARAAALLVFLAEDDWPDDHRRAFLRRISAAALHSARTHSTLPSIILAQAVLESGWGRSRLARRYHNLFGLKATGAQPAVQLPTLEHGPKGVHITRAAFRRFRTDAASISHHGRLLAEDPRYFLTAAQRTDWQATIDAIAPTYASDPAYPRRIAQIIRRYGLDRWDSLIDLGWQA